MARITEQELILPVLFVMEKSSNEELTTSEIIKKLTELIDVDEDDAQIIQGRSDSYFAQKVRNLKSHNTLVKNGFTTYESGKFKITEEGKKHLNENEEKLKLIIAEEKILHQYSAIITEYFSEFTNSINNIKELINADGSVKPALKQHYYNMLYSSVITSLETYLADALKYNLSKNEEYLIKFVESFQDFKNIKCDFNDIFNLCNSINNKVDDGLGTLLYHNLPKIQGIYKATFSISFLQIDDLMKAIFIRHDLVHRSGKNKNGIMYNITKNDVVCLCDMVFNFINSIEEQFKSLTLIDEYE
jgi:hypothetical protein